MTRWMAIRAPVALGRHGWTRREDIPDGKSGSRGLKGPKVGARGGAPKGPRKNRRVGSENQSAMIGRRGRRAPPSVSKTPVKTTTNVVDEPVDDAKRALVGALAAVALAAAPVADAMTEGGLIGNVDVAQLFELAGFGAPTGALDSPPLPEQQLKQILDLDERAALRKASLIRTGNYDVLLQELNALTQLDEKALEAADAEAALAAAARLTSNIRDVEDSYVAGADFEASARERQRVRLLDRRRLEAEFQTRLLQRKVDESRLGEQGNAIVYGAALAASFLSTAAMHPVDTVKVRRQTRESKGEGPSDDGGTPGSSSDSSSFDGDDYSFTTGNTSGTPSGAPSGSYSGGGSGTALETAPVVHVSIATATMEELDISTITDQYAGVKGSQRDSSDTFQNSPEPPSKEDKIFEPLGVPLTPTGLLSLYDGLAPNLLKEGPPLALYLGIYEALKTALLATDALREEPVLCYLIAGAVGELIGSLVRVPAEAVKSTRQADGTVTMADAMETSFGSERARSNLVRAWSVAVVRDVPFGAVQIALFEALKVALSGQCDPIIDGDSFFGEAVLGAFGGGVGAFISAPADVVVTRLIKQQSAGGEDGENDMGPIDMVRAIYAEGGVGAFFNGAGERVLYWAPAIGIFLTAYCQVRHALL